MDAIGSGVKNLKKNPTVKPLKTKDIRLYPQHFQFPLEVNRNLTMSLATEEKAAVVSLWGKMAPNAAALGAEALDRLFASSPETKSYFSHFDLSEGSADLQAYGEKLVNALGKAAQNLDSLDETLATLSEVHADKLKVDPEVFELLSHSIQIVLAIHFPQDFTAPTQAAWDKFLSAVSIILTFKY
ncbi:hemoglobin subunit alpha-3-like [Discoglossus pictus]